MRTRDIINEDPNDDDDLFGPEPTNQSPDRLARQRRTYAVDVRGKPFGVGDIVVRPDREWQGRLTIHQVTKVDGTKVYLDNSRQAMKVPESMAIVEKAAKKR